MFLNYYCFLLPLLLSYNAGYNFFMLQVLSFQILLSSFNFVFYIISAFIIFLMNPRRCESRPLHSRRGLRGCGPETDIEVERAGHQDSLARLRGDQNRFSQRTG